MRLLLKSLLAVFLLAFLSSCESDPIEIGENLLPDGDKLKLVNISSDSLNWDQYSYSYMYDSLNLGSSPRLLLGNFISNSNDNPYSIKSQFLVQWYFSLTDSIISQIESGELSVNSAWVTLKPNYNKSNYDQVDFSIYRINDEWAPTHFYKENLEALNIGTEDLFVDFLSMARDSVEGKTDSLISFYVSKELADSWLQVKADTSLPDKNYGVLFTPNNMASNIGFFSANASIQDYNPTIYIEYNRVIESSGFEYVDTLYSNVVMYDTHVNDVSGEIVLNINNKFILHSGIPTMSKFFIDLSELPANAVINKADLFFSVDTNNSQHGSVRSDTLYIIAYSDSTNDEISSSAGILYNSDGVYSGNITDIIQSWINGVDNQGLAISLSDAERSVSRVELFGSNAKDAALKPKVKIVYTTIPGQ